MVKLLTGTAMILLDAACCAFTFGGDSSPNALYGAMCVSLIGATPFITSCADAWFSSFSDQIKLDV